MKGKTKTTRILRAWLHGIFDECPVCKKSLESMIVYRTSARSVTLLCKTCSLRITVTWHSLRKAMIKAALLLKEESPRMSKNFKFLAEHIKQIAAKETRGKKGNKSSSGGSLQAP